MIYIALLLCIKAGAMQVKDFTVMHLGKAEGMTNQRVFSVMQTSSGAIWWASATGVGRYNGSVVKSYSLDENTPYSHLGGRFIHLATDSASIYAFDNRGSVYRFNVMRNRFEFFYSIPKALGHEVILNDIHITGGRFYLALDDGVVEQLLVLLRAADANRAVHASQHVGVATKRR